MEVRWTETALDHVRAIRDHIAADSPFFAERMAEQILSRSAQLSEHPRSGRVVPEREDPNVREIIEEPYRVIYRVWHDRVEVLAVVHGRRRLPLDIAAP
jgi:toxin ParE1/3/4